MLVGGLVAGCSAVRLAVPAVETLLEAMPHVPVAAGPARIANAAAGAVAVTAADAEDARHHQHTDKGEGGEARIVVW